MQSSKSRRVQRLANVNMANANFKYPAQRRSIYGELMHGADRPHSPPPDRVTVTITRRITTALSNADNEPSMTTNFPFER